MKKLFVVLIIFGFILLAFYFYGKNNVSVQTQNPETTFTPTEKILPTNPYKKSPTYSISQGETPRVPIIAPKDYVVHTFASGFASPRVLVFSPGGTLLVSDPTKGTVTALQDVGSKGFASSKKIVISGGNNIHGLAFYGGKLFVAEVDKISRYSWNESSLTAIFEKKLFNLPENNNHNKRTLIFDQSGKMYVSVGSTCNICKEGSNLSATILVSDSEGNNLQVYASGLRNAPFMAINPKTNEIWATEMGRDLLGDNIPPDEINIIRSSENYGWPYCYGNKVHDITLDPFSEHSCNSTTSPIYEISAHSAPLGLVFINSPEFPSDWQGDLLVAYHGSWNRTSPIGYKVVHLKVNGNSIIGSDDFLTGFINNNSYASVLGRPVDMVFDSFGNLYLSDDKAGNIYIIQKKIS